MLKKYKIKIRRYYDSKKIKKNYPIKYKLNLSIKDYSFN